MPHPIKIVFADDKELFRKAILQNLKDVEGLVCIGEAGNGEELLSLLKAKRPHVVLLDLEMPVMDGNEAMSRIMKLYPECRILVLSYHYEAELVEDYLRRGARGYLCKDVLSGNIPLLVEAIRKIHAGEVFVHDQPLLKNTHFSKRQMEIIPMICDDMTNKEIAVELGINQRSVEKQKQKLYQKTNSTGVSSFLKYALRKGFDFLEKRKHA